MLRDRRMARLLSLGEQAARASEARFAQSIAQAADAAAALSHIEGLILTAGPAPHAASVSGLAAGAQLRALLIPVAQTASARLQEAVSRRQAAEADLRLARDRASRLAEHAGDARRGLVADALQQEARDRPDHRRKADP